LLIALVGVALFSVMDALMKRASIATGVYSALLFRSLFGTALMIPVWWLQGGNWPEQSRLRIHVLRSAVVTGMALLFFFGLVRIPMADGIALSFFAPILALYLAAASLGEKIRRSAVLASLVGFAGVLVIGAGRLGHGDYSADAVQGIAAVLGSALLYAWNLVLQRRQAQLASPAEVALFQNLCVALFLASAAPWLARLPDAAALADIAAAAALAAAALMLLAWAYARAEAQSLVATEYSAFAWAALMGWVWFGEALTLATLAGAAMIVVACWIAARK